MSDLFDKRADGASRRDARTQKELQKKRKSRTRMIAVLTVVAIVFVCALFINSNIIRRTLPAITIGGVSFTAAEFEYFYNMAYFDYSEMINAQFSEMPEYAGSMLPAQNRSHSRQIYDRETGETWADFFTDWAIRNISELVNFYNASKAAGFVLEGEQRENFESELANTLMEAEIYASMYPQNYRTPEAYLQALFGHSINENALRNVFEFVFTALSYSEYVRDSFVYSEEGLKEFYNTYSSSLDIFRYRSFIVYPETLERLDFDTTTEFQEAQEAALLEASEIAQQIAVDIVTEEDFIAAARALDEYLYEDDDSTLMEQMGEWLDTNFALWLADESRKYGDVVTIQATAGTHVFFFVDRDNNDYYTTAMRQILIMRDDVHHEDYAEGEEEHDHLAELEHADFEALERAQTVLDLFISGGSTEDVFIELTEEYSDDSTPGGFYDRIARFFYQDREGNLIVLRVVPEIEDWLFDEARAFGDSELVYTEAYGYHLLYFMGHGERFRDIMAEDRMRAIDFTAWKEGFSEVEAVRHWVFALTQN